MNADVLITAVYGGGVAVFGAIVVLVAVRIRRREREDSRRKDGGIEHEPVR
jgi:hypothetical protein